jgi:membrane carboxypeptidase/penicillin-binding protein
MLGSPDYFSARIDGAVNGTTALRQPGSSIKPLTYAAAFQRGEVTPATMFLDVRTGFLTKEGTPYVPLNYDLQFRGPVRLREALASSYNVVAVKVLDTIGVEAMTGLARRLGITTFDDADRFGLAITLGGGEVRLLELSAAYAAMANGGHAIEPIAILRVEDAEGNLLLEAGPGVGDRVLDARVAYLLSDILADNTARIPSFGELSPLRIGRPAAAKTGTTTDFRDNWTVGYTPELAVGVWAGNADNEPMHNISGISGAAPIWHDFMEVALKGQPVAEFVQPDGLVEVQVCALSGQLPGSDCPHRVTELFLDGTEPTEACDMHRRIAVDRASGLRATEHTPSERVVERVYTLLPPEAQDWAHEQGISEPPPVSVQETASQAQRVAQGVGGDTVPLVVSAPDAGAIYWLDPALPRDAQRIRVSAWAEVAVREVTLLVDGQPLIRLGKPPYQALWRLEPGRHAFAAEGITLGGQAVVSGEVWIEVRE